jgi:hypothetical protein
LAGGNDDPVKGSKLGDAIGSPSRNRNNAVVGIDPISGKASD